MKLNRTRILVPSILAAAAVSLPLTALTSASAAGAAEPPTCQGVAATIVGTNGPDELSGTSGPDVIVARGGDDVILAGGGDDIVCAGAGDDRIRGGRGDDDLRAGTGDDDVFTERKRLDHFADDQDRVWGGGGADTVSTYSGVDRVLLGGGDDRVVATVTQVDGLDLRGGGGTDAVTLDASDVDHHLTLDARQGSLTAETLTAVVRGFTSYELVGGAAWTFRGTVTVDRVSAVAAGPVEMFTFAGNDVLWGSAFDDHLDGGGGTDRAHPGRGDDTCVRIEVGCG